jgi:hypothetical protein
VPARRWLRRAGIVAWASCVLAWTVQLTVQQFDPIPAWLYDWHVYAAAARGFLESTLYYEPLTSTFPLSVAVFNYPPLSALLVAPLLLLPDQVAGTPVSARSRPLHERSPARVHGVTPRIC